jgi:hypothetical protein
LQPDKDDLQNHLACFKTAVKHYSNKITSTKPHMCINSSQINRVPVTCNDILSEITLSFGIQAINIAVRDLQIGHKAIHCSTMKVSEKTAEQISTAAKTNASSYLAEIPPEVDPARHLLERYSCVSPEDVDAHIYQIVRLQVLLW